MKPEKDWKYTEDEDAFGNCRALNAIYIGVYKNILRIINTHISAKDT